MSKQAHIINPDVAVGGKALAICGKKHKVKVKWEDIPDDKPICRECVNVAVDCMNEAGDYISDTVFFALRLERAVSLIIARVSEPNALTRIEDLAAEYQDELDEQQAARDAEEAFQVTCVCTWNADQTINFLDPDCPIHAPKKQPPVAPEEAETTD